MMKLNPGYFKSTQDGLSARADDVSIQSGGRFAWCAEAAAERPGAGLACRFPRGGIGRMGAAQPELHRRAGQLF